MTILPGRRLAGLSPRLRGSHYKHCISSSYGGSIPASAGEPPVDAALLDKHWVYPRVCGGAGQWVRALIQPTGLSPRLRGSHHLNISECIPIGSIPASAGEPYCRASLCRLSWVYPRVCGGARANRLRDSQFAGLSPRLRGSRNAQSKPGDC